MAKENAIAGQLSVQSILKSQDFTVESTSLEIFKDGHIKKFLFISPIEIPYPKHRKGKRKTREQKIQKRKKLKKANFNKTARIPYKMRFGHGIQPHCTREKIDKTNLQLIKAEIRVDRRRKHSQGLEQTTCQEKRSEPRRLHKNSIRKNKIPGNKRKKIEVEFLQ